MAVVETFSIPSSAPHHIAADVYPGGGGRTVVLCHGFKGHRRWGFIPYVAGRLAEAGIAAVAIDFSMNGRLAPGSTEVGDGFPAPEAFHRNTIAREHEDLVRVIRWLRRGGCAPAGQTIGLWGHSRGGVAAILAALDDPDIPALVTWSAAAQPDFYTERQKAAWREKGAFEFTDGESKTALTIGVEYLDDLERNAAGYDLADRAGALRAPHLIVHGEHDLVIPIADAVRLYQTPDIAADKKLLRLATGHTFGYEGGDVGGPPSEALDQATRATVAWFEDYLPSTGGS